MLRPHRRTDQQIGSQIQLRRVFLGMSREQLGGLVGVSASALEAFEAGRLRLSPSLLIDIAKALRAPISYFFAEIRDLDE